MEKFLPSNIEAERAVLGSVLLNRNALAAVANWLLPDDFYLEQHAQIYAAMIDCHRRRTPPDAQLVGEVLRRRDQLDSIGGLPYLLALTDSATTSYHIESYGRAVQQTAVLRQLINVGGQIARIAYAEDKPLDEVLADAQGLLHPLVARLGGEQSLVRISDVIYELYDYLDGDGASPAIATGLRDYDDLTGGLWPGNLVIIAGRPRHGKSALAGTIAANVAKAGYNVAVFSLEMQRTELAMRYLAAESGIDGGKIRRRELNDAERTKTVATMGQMDWPLYLDDVRRTVSDIRSRCLRHSEERGSLDLLIVDYLQLVRPANSRDVRREQVGDIVRSLADIAAELKIPVVVPTQMNRDIEERNDKTPLLSDLGDSGEIERAAHVIGFLIRPELFDSETDDPGKALLYLEKDRNGPGGIIPLRWDGQRTTFSDLTYRTVDGY